VQRAWSEIMTVLANSNVLQLGVGILIFGGLSNFTQIYEARVCRHLFQAVDLSKTNKGAIVKQQKGW
jgi:hypothetical protein